MKTWLGIVISSVLINSALAEIRWDIPEIHSAAVATIGDWQQVKPPPLGETFRAWTVQRSHPAELKRIHSPIFGGASKTVITAVTGFYADRNEHSFFGTFQMRAATTQEGSPQWHSAASGGSGATYYLVVTPENGPHLIRVTTEIVEDVSPPPHAAGDYVALVEVNAFDAEGRLLNNEYRRLVRGFNPDPTELGEREREILLGPGHYQIYVGVGGFLAGPDAQRDDAFTFSVQYKISY